MRPLRNPGIVVLMLLAASGCAGMQSRVAWPSHASDEPHQSRLASWFKSRSWFHSTQDSPTPLSPDAGAQEIQTARQATPEADIWPEQRTARLPRLFSWFGRRNPDSNSLPAGSTSTPISMGARPTGYDERWVDGQVRPAAGEQPPSLATTTPDVNPAADKRKKNSDPASLSRTASTPSVKLYAPPQPEGDVALGVAPADLTEGSPAGLMQNVPLSAPNRRVEDPLVTVAGDQGSTETAAAQPPSPQPSSPPPPIGPGPARKPAQPGASRSQGTPSAQPRTSQQPGSSTGRSLGPPPAITPAPAPAAVPAPAST